MAYSLWVGSRRTVRRHGNQSPRIIPILAEIFSWPAGEGEFAHRRTAGQQARAQGRMGPAATPGQPGHPSLAWVKRGATCPAAWTPSGNVDGCHQPPQPNRHPAPLSALRRDRVAQIRSLCGWVPRLWAGMLCGAKLLSCLRGRSRYPAGQPNLRRADERGGGAVSQDRAPILTDGHGNTHLRRDGSTSLTPRPPLTSPLTPLPQPRSGV